MSEVSEVFIEDMRTGMSAALERTFTEEDVLAFARLSGDFNPAHVDAAYAAATRFGRPVAHGLLTASLISAVLGTKLPGKGAIYISQSLRFLAPVFIGDTVRAEAEVAAIDLRRRRVSLATRCTVGGKVVLKGEAVVLAPSRAQRTDA